MIHRIRRKNYGLNGERVSKMEKILNGTILIRHSKKFILSQNKRCINLDDSISKFRYTQRLSHIKDIIEKYLKNVNQKKRELGLNRWINT